MYRLAQTNLATCAFPNSRLEQGCKAFFTGDFHMPAQRGNRTLLMVELAGGIKYGFLGAELEAELGQSEVPANYPPGLVIGANSPKPARATKKTATGSKSGFVGTTEIPTARAAGWKVGRSKRRVGASNSRTKTVYVNIGGVKYAWPMSAENFTAIGADREVLGIEEATANDVLVFGASYPKPPRVAKIVGAGTANETSYSAFVDPDSLDNLPDGYVLVSSGNFVATA